MIDFKDEILSGEARYRVRNDSGDIINDNVIIEQITPVTQEGTELNKALLDKLISRLQLSCRYYPATSTTTNQINNATIDVPLEKYIKNQVVKMYIDPSDMEEITGDVFPTGFSTVSSVVDGFKISEEGTTEDLDNMFNASGTSYTYFSEIADYAMIECPIAIIPKTFQLILASTFAGTTQIIIEASNNGIVWETIADTTVSTPDSDEGKGTYNIETLTNKKYTFFKVHLAPATMNGGVSAYKFNIIEGQKSLYNELNETNLNINNLGNYPIKGTLKPNKPYSLIFDENVFILDE